MATIIDMARERSKSKPEPAPKLKDQYPLRVPDKYLGVLEAVEVHAKQEDRSVNMAIVLLLVKAMRDAGLYKAPDE